MTPHPEQLWLLPTVPRLLEPGEAPYCGDCARKAPRGYYGPPGTDTITLDDGNEHTIELRDTWFCRRHAKVRWDDWRDAQRKLSERRRWLAAHRHVEALGVKAARERFPMVDALLRSGWMPEGVAA